MSTKTIPTLPPLNPKFNPKPLEKKDVRSLETKIKHNIRKIFYEDQPNKSIKDLGTGEVYILMHAANVERDDTTTMLEYMKYDPEVAGEYEASRDGGRSLLTTMFNDDNIVISDDGTISVAPEKLEEIEEKVLEDIDKVGETLVPKIPTKKRRKKIGCSYKGIKIILSRTGFTKNRIEYYLPDSVDCMLKCYDRAIQSEGIDFDIMEHFQQKHKKLINKADGISVKACNDVIKELKNPEINVIPMCYVYVQNDKVKVDKITSKNTGLIGTSRFTIGLLYLGNDCYHAMLFKTDNLKNVQLSIEDITVEFGTSKEIVCKTRYLSEAKAKIPKRYIVVYDIETYVDEEMKLIPVTLGWGIVDLTTEDDDGNLNFVFDEDNMSNEHLNESIVYYEVLKNYESPEDLYVEFFTNCAKYITQNGLLKDEKSHVQVFAHNGGKFDHLYIRNLESVNILDSIMNGNQIKGMTIQIKGVDMTFSLKDSILFCLGSLKNCCKFLGCTMNKKDIDIVDKPLDWFINNEYHLEYLKYDILTLGEMIFRLNKMTMEFGGSVTNFMGLPGMAYHIMRKTCHGLDFVRLSDSPSLTKFISSSIYGGRVLQWETKSNKELVSLDFNSLYPSAMYAGAFPTGEPENITKLPRSHKEFISFMESRSVKHFIVEVDIEIPNIKRAYHPHKKVIRTTKTGNESYCLIYPSNQTITGVYNDVDLKEMIKDGYKIKQVHRGIYWKQSNRIFSDLVENFYNMRAAYKALPHDNPERPKEYVIKILLNAMYGKFNETINECTKYSKSEDFKVTPGTSKVRSKQLKNGQFEIVIKNMYPKISKPNQIASYILSYSRALMNELIRKVGPSNIHYSDTDSIYIPKDIYLNNEELLKFSHPNLCGYKNDYGEGVYIYKSIFLDLKRYYLEKNVNGKKEYTVKFNGLNYGAVDGVYSIFNSEDHRTEAKPRSDENLNDPGILKLDSTNRDEEFRKIFEQLYEENYIKRDFKGGLSKVKLLMKELRKTGKCIRSVHSETIFGISPHSRGQTRIIDGLYTDFGSLGYDWDKPEYVSELIANPNLFKMGDLERECKKKPVIRMTKYVGDDTIIIKAKLLPQINLGTSRKGVFKILRGKTLGDVEHDKEVEIYLGKEIYRPPTIRSNFCCIPGQESFEDCEIFGKDSRAYINVRLGEHDSHVEEGEDMSTEGEFYNLGVLGTTDVIELDEEVADIMGIAYSDDLKEVVQARFGKTLLSDLDKLSLLNLYKKHYM